MATIVLVLMIPQNQGFSFQEWHMVAYLPCVRNATKCVSSFSNILIGEIVPMRYALVPHGCCNKLLQMCLLKTKHTYFLMVLEDRSKTSFPGLKPRVDRAIHLLSSGSKGESVSLPAFLDFWPHQSNPNFIITFSLE